MVLRQFNTMNDGDIVKEGHLKRLKTQKKRYFVLRSSPKKGKSRLEYYESEKKFRQKSSPKRVIYLANCLNISKKVDSKHKSVFVLYTREDAFGLIADTEDELNSWLKSLKIEQKKDEILNASVSTWPVIVKPRGLGTSKNLTGQFDLQLASRTLALVKKDTRDPVMELQLVNIRRCGHTDCFFFMELGRGAATGAGELWIQVDDQVIAQNMHEAILGAMHNISISDIPPIRRRCASEGKRGKGKPRPVSAVVYPPTRGRADTEPSSPLSPFRVASASSTKNLSSSESPKSKQPSGLNRFLPRRKSKDVNASLDNLYSNKETNSDFNEKVLMSPFSSSPPSSEQKDVQPVNASLDNLYSNKETNSDFNEKVLMSPFSSSPPSSEQKDVQPEYVNIGGAENEEPASSEYYVKMGGNRRKSSDSYMDMEPSKPKGMKAFGDQQTQAGTKTTHITPEGGYMDMTSLRQQAQQQSVTPKIQNSGMRSEFIQQKKTSSPRQLRTSESPLPNKPDIREFVSIKKSPSASRRRSSQDYIDMNPLAFARDEPRSYVNFVPASNSKKNSSRSDLTNQRDDFPSYVNFVPGNSFEKKGKQIDSDSPKKHPNILVESSSYEEMHSYVNFSPGKIHDQTPVSNNLRKHSLESILTEQPREYMNVDFSGIAKSKSAVDMPEYVNFVPGRLFESSQNGTSLANGEAETNAQTNTEQDLDYVCFSPGKLAVENETWRKLPRSRRRESEPAMLLPRKGLVTSTLDSNKEDEEIGKLNYVMLDLNQDAKNSPESPSRRRTRPPNIDLSSCRRAAPGPRSAPIKSVYAEVDFTKSDGIRQARQEAREPANTAV